MGLEPTILTTITEENVGGLIELTLLERSHAHLTRFPSGIYFARIETHSDRSVRAKNFTDVKKMVLLRQRGRTSRS